LSENFEAIALLFFELLKKNSPLRIGLKVFTSAHRIAACKKCKQTKNMSR